MVCASRCTTWRTLISWFGVPGTPALRKYLLTTMSVASCDQSAGTSTPSMAKTVEPSGFAMTVLRRSQRTLSNGCCPGLVKRRGTCRPACVGVLVAEVGVEAGVPVHTNCDIRTSLGREAVRETCFSFVPCRDGLRGSRTPLHQVGPAGREGTKEYDVCLRVGSRERRGGGLPFAARLGYPTSACA